MRIAFDMSSVLWTSLQAGKDVEGTEVEFEDRKVYVNSAAYGYENAVNLMVAAIKQFNLNPMNAVMVFEGKNSKSRRAMIYPYYKGNRDTRPPEAYEEFNKLKEMVKTAFRNVGAIAVHQDFVEGDDVLAWLAKNTEEDLVVVSNDNDLVVLHGVNSYGAEVICRIGDSIGRNKYGDFDLQLVTLYKSLVGDSSDNIKGCPGFGPAAFQAVNTRYGDDGCFELLNLIATGQRDEVANIAEEGNCKYLRMIAAKWDEVLISYKLVLLHPEWVDTVKLQPEWLGGFAVPQVDDERLAKWKGQHRLVTTSNYEAACQFMQSKLPESPFIAFDIETSTPSESDDWKALNSVKVDVIGSYLVGFSATFGANMQYSFYVTVAHSESGNVSMSQARKLIELFASKPTKVQNMNFELPVLYLAQDEDGTLWRDHWKDNGFQGFLPNVNDTKFEASYVDENIKTGLKLRSNLHLGYEQQTYEDTTELLGKPFKGGEPFYSKKHSADCTRYKMHELPASHVVAYGIDDAAVTAGLHNFYKLVMQLEHTYYVSQVVEIDAAYMHAESFVTGMNFDMAKCKTLEREDNATRSEAWAVLRKFLVSNGWDGTVPPDFVNSALDAKALKLAYRIVTDQLDFDSEDSEDDELEDGEEPEEVVEVKDPVIKTRVRTPSKVVQVVREAGQEKLAGLMDLALTGQPELLQTFVMSHFKGEPSFKVSNKQMTRLLYGVMGLPVRVRGKVTKTMKANGQKFGNPKADALAIEYAIRDATPEQVQVLQAVKLVTMVKTRVGLYYSKYPYFVHWKTGKIHSSHNQTQTNTRRASSSAPNLQQQPKHPKIEGQPARFREVVIPHKADAVIVSMDFASQELRVIAEYSKDQAMLDCLVGNSTKDMHALTGSGILQKNFKDADWTYEKFMESYLDKNSENYKLVKDARTLGKKVNFTTEYGAGAAKLAQTLLVTEEEAQTYIDAKEALFHQASKWKRDVTSAVKSTGYESTMLGAKRHLAKLLSSEDSYVASKADRQAVNFKVQSSSAEMTKCAEGRMFKAGLTKKYDAQVIGPIHDEIVASCTISDLPKFLPEMHACMVANYAGMFVPIVSSISFGPNFSAQIEIGEEPTPEAIALGFGSL